MSFYQNSKTISINIVLVNYVKNDLPCQTSVTFYKAYIQSHIDNCHTIWLKLLRSLKSTSLKNMTLRIITDKGTLTHLAPPFD